MKLYLYALPKFKGRVVSNRGFEYYFDRDGRGIGEVVAAVIDSQAKALTLEEAHLNLRDVTGFSMNIASLGKLLRKNGGRVRKWGRNHRITKSYLYYTHPEQLARRLSNKGSLLSETLRLVLHNTNGQCLSISQCAEHCHMSEGLVRCAVEKLSLLGLRKTELFHGLRIVCDPAMPENEVVLSKQNIEREIRQKAEAKFAEILSPATGPSA